MMKQISRTTVYIIVSLLIHFTILLYLPGVDFTIKVKEKEFVDIELIKVPMKSIRSDISPLNRSNAKSMRDEKRGIPPSSGIIKPSVDLPIVSVIEKIPLSETINESASVSITSKNSTGESLGKEIISSEKRLKSGENVGSGDRKVISTGKSDFFEITSSGKSERKIVYIPEKPTFSLQSNTKVRLKFSIDSKGVPYSIILLTRSNPEIEKLAIKFVSGIRFESVSYKDVDTAEITVYFNVR